MRIGSPFSVAVARRLPATIATACMVLMVPAAPASAASAWVSSPQSRARLIDGGVAADGTRRAGIEIELEPGAHTYWRSPGDTGVPPELSTDKSGNLASAEMLYPAPAAITEAGATVFGYQGRVVFPVLVHPTDPARPVDLAVDLAYATCADICVPGRLQAKLTLGSAPAPADEVALVAAAEARVPKPADAPGAPSITARAIPPEKGKPAWHVDVTPAQPDATLFSEAPEPWFLTARRDPAGGFVVVAEEAPKDPAAEPPLAATFTLVMPSSAYEKTLDLDVASSAP